MKRSILLFLLGLTAAAGCGGDDERREPGPRPGPRIELAMMDDAQLLYASPQGIRDAVGVMKDLGADRIRITAGWSVLAPDPQGTRRPQFDATDSRNYPQQNWDILDRAVTEVDRQGMKVMLDASFWAPRWATGRKTPGRDRHRWLPDADEFGQFAQALARRYNGDFKSPATGQTVPRVRLWTTWNEPNHSAFLLPQQVRREDRWVVVAAHHYRAMHERGLAAIKRVSPDNRVLLGGLASLASKPPAPNHTTSPLKFLRDLACVDRALRPLRIRECRDFRPLDADGFAIHPYTRKAPPGKPLPNTDDVGISDLGKLSSLLAQLRRSGRIARALPIYNTEFGYETEPPDPKRGIPVGRQAGYLNQAAAIVHQFPAVRMHSQFVLRDLPQDRLFQTGLLLPEGPPKPAFATFALPFWIDGFEAWGRVYPADRAVNVVLERRDERGIWRRAGRPIRTGADGSFRRRLRQPGLYRARWEKLSSWPAITSERRAGGG